MLHRSLVPPPRKSVFLRGANHLVPNLDDSLAACRFSPRAGEFVLRGKAQWFAYSYQPLALDSPGDNPSISPLAFEGTRLGPGPPASANGGCSRREIAGAG